MSIYSPYFYTIKHIPSELMYAGCKFGKDAYPEKFMTEDGYQTSSSDVKDLIASDGLDSFEIIELLLEDQIGDVYQFETTFLRSNKIASDKNWLNCHENYLAPFCTPEFKAMMMKIHGVENSWEVPGWSEKRKQTNLERYGAYHSEESIEKRKQTNLERYGVSCGMNTPEQIAQRIKSNIEKYGTANNYDQIKKTCLERYGVEYVSQSEQAKESFISTCREKYGADHYMSSPEYYEQFKKKLLDSQGVENVFQRKDVIQKIKEKRSVTCSTQEYKMNHRRAIKDGLKDIDRSGENNSFFGKTHSEETRSKISAAKAGVKHPRYCCIKCHKELGTNNKTNHEKVCKL